MLNPLLDLGRFPISSCRQMLESRGGNFELVLEKYSVLKMYIGFGLEVNFYPEFALGSLNF